MGTPMDSGSQCLPNRFLGWSFSWFSSLQVGCGCMCLGWCFAWWFGSLLC